MGEASAIEDGTAKGRGRLQCQCGGAELVWRLGTSPFRHRAGQVWILEGPHLDRPSPSGRGGLQR